MLQASSLPQSSIPMSNLVKLGEKVFVPATELDLPEWSCEVVNDRPQPTITLKDDDLFEVQPFAAMGVQGADTSKQARSGRGAPSEAQRSTR